MQDDTIREFYVNKNKALVVSLVRAKITKSASLKPNVFKALFSLRCHPAPCRNRPLYAALAP